MADVDAEKDRRKVLLIVFGLIIFLSSISILQKICRRHLRHGDFTFRITLMFTQSAGVLFLVLFSLVIRLLEVEGVSVSCRISTFGIIYEFFFLPFVFGVGLCIMAVESSISALRPKMMKHFKRHTILCVAIAPWIAGVIVVLPVGLTDFDYALCGYVHDDIRHGAIVYWLCVVVPMILLVVFSVIVRIVAAKWRKNTDTDKYIQQTNFENETVHETVGQINNACVTTSDIGGKSNNSYRTGTQMVDKPYATTPDIAGRSYETSPQVARQSNRTAPQNVIQPDGTAHVESGRQVALFAKNNRPMIRNSSGVSTNMAHQTMPPTTQQNERNFKEEANLIISASVAFIIFTLPIIAVTFSSLYGKGKHIYGEGFQKVAEFTLWFSIIRWIFINAVTFYMLY